MDEPLVLEFKSILVVLPSHKNSPGSTDELATGVGLTVISDKKFAPVHPAGEVGTIVYLTMDGVELLLLNSVCTIGEPFPELNPVEVPLWLAPDHAKVVPEIDEFNTILVVPPLQIVALVIVPAGFGLTVTSTVNGLPAQPDGEVGVTI